ncbi:hypothetical protein BDD12DRAFT_860728, partial [Trichophaea hybrida]
MSHFFSFSIYCTGLYASYRASWLLVYRTFEFVRSRLTYCCIRTGKVIVVTWLGLQRVIYMLHILTIRVAKFHEIVLYKLAQGLTGV